MISGIYKILNTNNNLFYVGSAINLKIRFRNHINELNRNKHSNLYLQNAWNKYGEQAFVFEVIEECEKEKLIEREQYWIDFTKCIRPNGYNLHPIAGSPLGFKHSKETKDKQSNSHKGKPKSEIHRKNIKKSWEIRRLNLIKKWPHKDGFKCKCNECFLRRKIYHQKRYREKLNEKQSSYL